MSLNHTQSAEEISSSISAIVSKSISDGSLCASLYSSAKRLNITQLLTVTGIQNIRSMCTSGNTAIFSFVFYAGPNTMPSSRPSSRPSISPTVQPKHRVATRSMIGFICVLFLIAFFRLMPEVTDRFVVKTVKKRGHLYNILVVLNDSEEAIFENIRHEDIPFYRKVRDKDGEPFKDWVMNNSDGVLEKRMEVQFLDVYGLLQFTTKNDCDETNADTTADETKIEHIHGEMSHKSDKSNKSSKSNKSYNSGDKNKRNGEKTAQLAEEERDERWIHVGMIVRAKERKSLKQIEDEKRARALKLCELSQDSQSVVSGLTAAPVVHVHPTSPKKAARQSQTVMEQIPYHYQCNRTDAISALLQESIKVNDDKEKSIKHQHPLSPRSSLSSGLYINNEKYNDKYHEYKEKSDMHGEEESKYFRTYLKPLDTIFSTVTSATTSMNPSALNSGRNSIRNSGRYSPRNSVPNSGESSPIGSARASIKNSGSHTGKEGLHAGSYSARDTGREKGFDTGLDSARSSVKGSTIGSARGSGKNSARIVPTDGRENGGKGNNSARSSGFDVDEDEACDDVRPMPKYNQKVAPKHYLKPSVYRSDSDKDYDSNDSLSLDLPFVDVKVTPEPVQRSNQELLKAHAAMIEKRIADMLVETSLNLSDEDDDDDDDDGDDGDGGDSADAGDVRPFKPLSDTREARERREERDSQMRGERGGRALPSSLNTSTHTSPIASTSASPIQSQSWKQFILPSPRTAQQQGREVVFETPTPRSDQSSRSSRLDSQDFGDGQNSPKSPRNGRHSGRHSARSVGMIERDQSAEQSERVEEEEEEDEVFPLGLLGVDKIGSKRHRTSRSFAGDNGSKRWYDDNDARISKDGSDSRGGKGGGVMERGAGRRWSFGKLDGELSPTGVMNKNITRNIESNRNNDNKNDQEEQNEEGNSDVRPRRGVWGEAWGNAAEWHGAGQKRLKDFSSAIENNISAMGRNGEGGGGGRGGGERGGNFSHYRNAGMSRSMSSDHEEEKESGSDDDSSFDEDDYDEEKESDGDEESNSQNGRSNDFFERGS